MSFEKAKEYLVSCGVGDRIQQFDVSSATVDLAAKAVGVEGARICKTLTFQVPGDENACIMIQMAGDAKLNNQKFKATFHHKGKMLTPDKALELTGHAVGGVCAFGVDNPNVRIYCDESLKRFDTVFPAVGDDASAVELTCDELYRFSKAIGWIDVTKIPEPAAEEGKA